LFIYLGVAPSCWKKQWNAAAIEAFGESCPTRNFQPASSLSQLEEAIMNGLIYLVGLIVVIGVILSFFGLR
jgi:hypothetical protein